MYRASLRPFGLFLSPWVKRLIIANAVIYLLAFARVIPLEWQVRFLGFNPARILLEPWGLLTYMFVHAGFLHVFINMLMLFFFGPPLEERWGGRDFLKYYAICGVGGAFFTLLFGGGTIVGASGAVYGIMLAYAMNWPDNLIWFWGIFPIKAKYFVLFLGGIAFFSSFQGSADGVAHLAHLGGFVVGYVYLKKGWSIGARVEGMKRSLRRRKLTVVPGSGGSGENESGRGQSEREARMLDEVDRILDKIAASGIGSLTPDERKFLDEIAKRRKAESQ